MPSLETWRLAQKMAGEYSGLSQFDSLAAKPKLRVTRATTRQLREDDALRAMSLGEILDEMDMPGWKTSPIIRNAVYNAQNARFRGILD